MARVKKPGFNNQKQSLVFDRLCYMPSIARETPRGHVQIAAGRRAGVARSRRRAGERFFFIWVSLQHQEEQNDANIKVISFNNGNK